MSRTTIPGTVGITGGHYDTIFGEIWSASGPAPATGSVTLIISAGTDEEFRTSKSIQPAEDCPQPTETPAPTVTPTPTPTHSPEQSVQAGTGTPQPQVPNTSMQSGNPGGMPVIAFEMLLVASLAALAFVEARAIRRR